MASVRSTPHRRRSRSVSTSSSTSRHSPDFSLRIATKRLYPIPGNISLPHKWDLDTWRRGKRRRYGFSSPQVRMNFPEAQEQHNTPRPAVSSGFTFPSSSADFNFFPKSTRSSRRRASYSSPISDGGLANPLSRTELTLLRSNAFWELHRSVTENGEGFVQRMRDYEYVRSCQSAEPTRRGRKWGFHSQTPRNASYIADSDKSDDEEDIQILAGDLPADSNSCSSRHGKRAVSMDIPYYHLRDGEQGYNQVSHRDQPLSLIMLQGNPLPAISDYPLSPSGFSSTNTSLFSSPIQPQHPDVGDSFPSLSLPPSFSPSVSASFLDHTPSVPSDKAISEITLALANGAGAINDYNRLQTPTNFDHMKGGEPGELWH